MSKTKLPALSKVKRFLYADWALRVKIRDDFKCLLCGCEDNLTSHHWYICDHHAHAARYCVDNGATLCYTCHIRGVHQRADYYSVRALYNIIRQSPGFDVAAIERLAAVEPTTGLLRSMWNVRRSDPAHPCDEIVLVETKGRKTFVTVFGRQIAVPGGTVNVEGCGIFEVAVVAKTPDGYRYTVRRIEEPAQ